MPIPKLDVRDDIKTKKTFQFGQSRIGGGGLPLPEFFCALFLLKEKVSSMVATAERVGKVARIGGWGGGLANSGNARIETFFLFCTRPLGAKTCFPYMGKSDQFYHLKLK